MRIENKIVSTNKKLEMKIVNAKDWKQKKKFF